MGKITPIESICEVNREKVNYIWKKKPREGVLISVLYGTGSIVVIVMIAFVVCRLHMSIGICHHVPAIAALSGDERKLRSARPPGLP